MDLLAYQRVATGTHVHRAALLQPATYHDLLLLSRGVTPGETTKGGKAKPRPAKAAEPVRVLDGGRWRAPTSHETAIAEVYARNAMAREMVKSGKSTPEGVAWLLSHAVEGE